MSLPPPPHQTETAPHWQGARRLWDWATQAFGAPSWLAAQRTFSDAKRRVLLEWLRPLEALVRRLLLIDALALKPPAPAPRAHRAGAHAGGGRGGFACEDSARWSVRFQVLPPRRGQRADRKSGRTPFASAPGDCWSLAERLEALRRVIADPAPIALRLARRLKRHAARAKRLLRLPRRAAHSNSVHSALREISPLLACAQSALLARAHSAFPDTS